MKLRIAVPIFLIAAISFAESIALQPLAQSGFLDTEVSTNIVIATDEGSRHFSVMLSLAATASNCVVVAVGNDSAPTNGYLAPAEEAFGFGWDCGSWFLSAPSLTSRVEIAPIGADARKSLTLRIGINSNGAVRDVSLLDDGATLPVGPFALPEASFWDMLRVTVRGTDPALEDLVVRHSPDGTQLIFQ